MENIAGHLQVKTCVKTCNSVVHRAPVGHDKTIKAPFSTGNIGEKLFVFRGVFTVYLVVCAHQGSRLALFHDMLKSLEIYLAEGALVYYRITEISVFFIVVASVVLNRGTDASVLNSTGQSCAHKSADERILGEVFKASAAEGVALYVDRRTEN